MLSWSMYILQCADDSYYVGHSQDVEQCVEAHNKGEGARFTAMHRPCRLVYTESFCSKEQATKRERQIKGWTKKKKASLTAGDIERLRILSKKQVQT